MLQYLLLGVFAATAALSFFFRLRVGMIEGAVDRGARSADEVQASRAQFARMAMVCAVVSAVSLILCIAVGAAQKFL